MHSPWLERTILQRKGDSGHEEIEGNGIDAAVDPHDGFIHDGAVKVAGDRTEEPTDRGRGNRHHQPDLEGGSGTLDCAGEDVLPVDVGTEPVRGGHAPESFLAKLAPVLADESEGDQDRDDPVDAHDDHGGYANTVAH